MTQKSGQPSLGGTNGVPPPIAAARIVLHVDMDAFYASVEVLFDPTLAGKPVIVGGSGTRGVVASCSYEARAYGIRSAMSSVQARRLCPQAIFLPGRHGVYAEYSQRLHEVFQEFTPLVEGIALDEAFLDVTGLVTRGRADLDGADVASTIRTRVHERLRLWCSVGVASSKLIAKLASKAAKPEAPPRPGHAADVTVASPIPGARRADVGVVVVERGCELDFLHPLPARALWGLGPATFSRLTRFGVVTVGDLAALPEETVVRALGPAMGTHLHALAWGRDDRAIEPDRALKSVGHEETFPVDRFSVAELRLEALRLADAVGRRLREGGHRGRTVNIKVRFADFRTLTRSKTMPSAVDTAAVIYETALALLEHPDLKEDIETFGVRLFGVSVTNLADDAPEQLDLFGAAPAQRDEALTRAVDSIRQRFGDTAVGPAALATPQGLRVKRKGDTQWGPDEVTPGVHPGIHQSDPFA